MRRSTTEPAAASRLPAPRAPAHRRLRVWIAAAVLAAPAVPSLAQPAQDPCADLGSFAVVDGPPVPRGQPLVAQPYQPCADLPGQPQPHIFIDAQVQVPNPQGPPDGLQPLPPRRPFQHRR